MVAPLTPFAAVADVMARPRIRKRLAVTRLRGEFGGDLLRRAYVASFRRRCAMRTRSRRAVCAAASKESRTRLCLQLYVTALLHPQRLQPLKSSASRLRLSSKTRPEQVQQQWSKFYGNSSMQRAERLGSQIAFAQLRPPHPRL